MQPVSLGEPIQNLLCVLDLCELDDLVQCCVNLSTSYIQPLLEPYNFIKQATNNHTNLSLEETFNNCSFSMVSTSVECLPLMMNYQFDFRRLFRFSLGGGWQLSCYEDLIKEKLIISFSSENELTKLVENFLYFIFNTDFCQS